MKIVHLSTTPAREVITAAISTLKSGGLVVYPTETTYGIGADATNQKAVDKLLQYKKRREGKPLSIAVFDQSMAEIYVELNAAAKKVYTTFLPGPITVVSKSKGNVAKGVTSETGALGIRIPNYPLILQLIKAYGKPITATGANASYKKRPYTIQDIFSNISEKQKSLIDVVLDAGELPHNEPSTVIDTTLDDIEVLRQGSITFSETSQIKTHSTEETVRLGKKIVQKYKNLLSYKALVFCLVGELGAGKTQFSKGIAEGLGIKKTIVSPTFTLSRNYPFEGEGKKLEFVHIDTWRLFSSKEFLDLGFAQMIDSCDVIAVEWADKVHDVLNQYSDEAKLIWVKFEYGKDENERTITI
ncbi:MAG TPA: hypothetical protein DCX25_04550 [Candidatus Pacebacteria bacterium]|nr:MAG: Sua5/YciO/YrdC/YwlC family protein [Microgenomates group bacterium GW2011_GWB1_45_17]KKU23403.1 MAG: Sua5/YciO/YrdC/YwlC family protein [Microgenomates group bacterium GW2011_GWA1_46_15]KKU24467.1 MAG: Sua5/YciO/YrdC/YwlC family protein [Microgenomates group bacterium GW2011_GWC1_46_15]HAV15570.1 hypothetical protein [Candidatus Paceibacterota bacterium]HCR10897.1 hypothetical protein [Candidatus Paceibacterota bacterium]